MRVLDLYHKDWQQKTIAEALGISKGYVSQLVKRIKDLPQEERGAALKIVKRAGRKVTSTSEQKGQILASGLLVCSFARTGPVILGI